MSVKHSTLKKSVRETGTTESLVLTKVLKATARAFARDCSVTLWVGLINSYNFPEFKIQSFIVIRRENKLQYSKKF